MKEMKDSGIKWIGEIPKDWKVSHVKYVATFHNGDRSSNYPSGEDMVDEGIYFLTSNNIHGIIVDDSYEISKFITEEKYQSLGGAKIKLDDLILCLRGSVGNCAINKALHDGTIASSLVAIRPNGIVPEFLNYILNSHVAEIQTLDYMNGSCAANLSVENVSRYYFIEPSFQEQLAIVSVLDNKCAEIDALSADIQSEIETLEAYKRSKVFDTVMHGIDHTDFVQTDSDVWSTIPKGWKLVDIKYIFEIVKRIAGKEGYDVIAITQQGLKYKDITSNEGQLASDYSGYQFVYPGDYAMNHMDLLTGWVDLSDKFGVTSPDYRVFRLRYPDFYDRKYYKYIMQCCYMNRIFYSLGQGVSNLGRWRLQTSAFNNFKVPVPPYEEQVKIGNYLDEEISQINSIIVQKREQLEVLADYKKSVIYEYVTGKKEVPAV